MRSTPEAGLCGDLAGILALASGGEKPVSGETGLSEKRWLRGIATTFTELYLLSGDAALSRRQYQFNPAGEAN
jgi:hypothetical protein